MDNRAVDRGRAAILVLILLKLADATFTATGEYSSASAATSQGSTHSRTLSTTGFRDGTTSFRRESTPRISEAHPSFTDRLTRTVHDQTDLASDETFFSTVTESWTSHGGLEMSTELLNSSPNLTTDPATEWDEPSTLANITDAYLGFSSEQQPDIGTDLGTDPRTDLGTDLGTNLGTDPGTELRTDLRTVRDLTVTDLDTTESVSHAGSTYVSTSNNRAGERTLLSITSNSGSRYTDNSGTSGTSPDAFTEQLRRSLASTEDLPTNTTLEDESEVSSMSQTTQVQTEQPNVTGRSFDSVPETNESSSTLSILKEDETETTVHSSTIDVSYTDGVSTSSISPFALTEESRTDPAHRETETTHTFTESSSTTLDKRTDPPQTFLVETTVTAMTSAPPTLRTDTTRLDESSTQFPSTLKPFIPQTSRPVEPTQVLTTAAGPVTHKPPLTEKYPTTPAATTAPPGSSTAALLTTRQTQPTTVETLASHSPSTAHETTQMTTNIVTRLYHPSLRTTLPSRFTSSSQTEATTDVTGTASLDGNKTPSGHTTASYRKSAPTMRTEVMSTEKPAEMEGMTETMPARSTQAPVHMCVPTTCMNGGRCVTTSDGIRCECLPAWTGNTCTEDVDECMNSPCPPESLCVNTRGSFSCECPLGFDLQDGRRCMPVKIFLGSFRINGSQRLRNNGFHELQKEIIQLLNASLSNLRGYRRSTLRNVDGLLSAVSMFSMSAGMASTEIRDVIRTSLRNCSMPYCSRHQFTYQMESLCRVQDNRCDTQYSVCDDTHGTVYCQCHRGYFKKNPEDTTCRDCGDGFEFVNGTCRRCAFGFGGFNCNNFYGLIAKVVSPAAGGLLLVVIIALIITCCRKDKNDINKIIFKSGELQMSPYPEFPKSSRVSMEWGRETIEMQENGSTKNLLQMTDIYYSPALRNADLERNGLYPFTGLPGSRHSCIYPAQWNPSFISDDSRRRDYF